MTGQYSINESIFTLGAQHCKPKSQIETQVLREREREDKLYSLYIPWLLFMSQKETIVFWLAVFSLLVDRAPRRVAPSKFYFSHQLNNYEGSSPSLRL